MVIISKRDLNLSSISGIDLQLRPTNSAQDMLRLVPGLFIAQHAGGGKAEQMFLRGFDIDHGTDLNITVDGMPVNMVSHAHGQGYADLHFLIPELVERVNFATGPYDISKGNFATAGFVGFETAKRLDNSFIKMEGGLYGNFRTVAAVNLFKKENSGKHAAYIAGEYNYNRGYFNAPQHYNRFNILAKYTSYISADKIVTVSLSAFRSNWDASGQIPQRLVDQGIIDRFGAVDSTEGGLTNRYNLNIEFLQSLNKNAEFKNNTYLTYYDFELYSNFTFFLNDSVNGDQIRQKEKRVLAGNNSQYTFFYKIKNSEVRTDFGAGFRYDNSMNNELSRTKNRSILTQRLAYGDINELNVYGYINQKFFILPELVLHAGLRFDYFIHDYTDKLDSSYTRKSATTYAFSPKSGIFYNLKDKARFFFNFGIGFHSNDTRVVVQQAGRDVLPLAFSYDLGAVFKPFPKLVLSATGWILDLQQEFVYVGDEAVVEPGGRTRRMGIDFSARYEILKWLFLDGDFNYTHARARDEAAGQNFIPLASQLSAIGGITFKVKDFLSASVRFRYLGDRPANEDYSQTATGYALLDAVIQYSRPRYAFGVQVQNILNSAWNEAQFDTESRLLNEVNPVSEIHFTPGTPIAFRLSAAYKF